MLRLFAFLPLSVPGHCQACLCIASVVHIHYVCIGSRLKRWLKCHNWVEHLYWYSRQVAKRPLHGSGALRRNSGHSIIVADFPHTRGCCEELCPKSVIDASIAIRRWVKKIGKIGPLVVSTAHWDSSPYCSQSHGSYWEMANPSVIVLWDRLSTKSTQLRICLISRSDCTTCWCRLRLAQL